jgi:glutamate racemase
MRAETRPIGFFDSGIGGLSIWREVVHRLPHESTIYVADSAYCPYGSRPLEEIQARAVSITRFLLDYDCKLVVVACNTASAAAVELLRARFDLPLVGIEPAIKPAAQASQTGHIGVLATAGTIQGNLFQNTARRYANGVQAHLQVGEGLVEQIEAGQLNSPDTERLLRHYLDPMLAAEADQIVLGCTHYPLLMPLIQRIVAGRAQVIDPAQAVARQVQRVLAEQNDLRAHNSPLDKRFLPTHRFYTTGQPRTFNLWDGLSSQENEMPISFKPVEL